MDTSDDDVKCDHGKPREDLLDERFASCANPRGGCSVNTVKKLRGRNRGERHGRVSMERNRVVPVETATLGSDQHTRIDQRRHGDFGTLGWRLVMAATVSQYFASGFALLRRNATNSSSVHVDGVAGVNRPTGSPPLSMRNVSPR